MGKRIPSTVTIGRRKYTVTRIHSFGKQRDKYADINYNGRQIRIAENIWSKLFKQFKPLTTDEMWEAYWHEVVHGILHDMQRHDINSERFVNAFCKRLYTILKGK